VGLGFLNRGMDEVAPPQQPTLGGGEHQPLRARLAVIAEVFSQGGGRHRRQGHGASAGLGLGRPPGEVPVDLGRLFRHGDLLMEQVHPLIITRRPTSSPQRSPA
jgi:hypothetical protein